jgi:hypothetical protein
MDKKECKNCKKKLDCKLYLSSEWQGNIEAERCKKYEGQEL